MNLLQKKENTDCYLSLMTFSMIMMMSLNRFPSVQLQMKENTNRFTVNQSLWNTICDDWLNSYLSAKSPDSMVFGVIKSLKCNKTRPNVC